MHTTTIDPWKHRHDFGADAYGTAERRTRWVVGLTASMMAIEIAAGTAFGSMALLTDGWHMGTHAAALGVAAFAYAFSRRHAGDPRYGRGLHMRALAHPSAPRTRSGSPDLPPQSPRRGAGRSGDGHPLVP